MQLQNDLFKSILKKQIEKMNLSEKDLELIDASQFSTDENGNSFDFSNDVFFDRILEKGTLKVLSDNEIASVLDMPYGLCHQNAIKFIDSENYQNEVVYTGFALNDGNEWFIHTYLMEGDTIIDTTETVFRAYFGFALSKSEIQELRNCTFNEFKTVLSY